MYGGGKERCMYSTVYRAQVNRKYPHSCFRGGITASLNILVSVDCCSENTESASRFYLNKFLTA